MAIPKFLQFFTTHNSTIIEVLVGVVFFLVIYLAFRHYFGPQGKSENALSAMDTNEIEKTLQRILENQSKVSAGPSGELSSAAAAAPAAAMMEAGGSGGAAGTVSGADPQVAAQLKALQAQLIEKEKALAIAKEEAAKAASAPAATAPAEKAESVKNLESKIKDLEARLAEYEIISEDIADLSFYKEENVRLQNELANKAGGAPGSAPVAPAAPASTPAAPPAPAAPAAPSTPAAPPAPAAAAAPAASTAPASNPVSDPSLTVTGAGENAGSQTVTGGLAQGTDAVAVPTGKTGGVMAVDSATTVPAAPPAVEPAAPVAATPPAVEPAAPVPAAPPAETPEADIMKEFAKAVEQQKEAVGAPPPPAMPTNTKENTELMNQFENFVKKG